MPTTPSEPYEDELEMALMDVFSKVAEFGRVFLTNANKEEFLKSIDEGALDPQEAAHVAMALIKSHTERKNAISSGKMTRLPCYLCGEEKSEGHHLNYDYPYKVVWLCRKHHKGVHYEQ